MPPSSRRWTVQRLMIGVAVVALTLGLGLELQTRRERDAAAAQEAVARRYQTWHTEQAASCQAAQAQARPYNSKQRRNERRQSAERAGVAEEIVDSSNWTTERDYHTVRAEQWASTAETEAQRKNRAQRRLLIPF